MKNGERAGGELEKLIGIIARLREPGGCPWDREQTVGTLTGYLLEEVYEAVEACQNGDGPAACEELGDVFMEIVFLCRMFEEKGEFNAAEALDGINTKMIDRHPHVFGGAVITDSGRVAEEWSKRKLREKGRSSVLEGVGWNMPALFESFEIGRKAAGIGFDWPDAGGVFGKLDEEKTELEEAVAEGDARKIEEEMGDLLLTAASLARHLGVNPETALRRANRKFRARFGRVEKALAEKGRTPGQSSLEEMDALWDEAKEAKD